MAQVAHLCQHVHLYVPVCTPIHALPQIDMHQAAEQSGHQHVLYTWREEDMQPCQQQLMLCPLIGGTHVKAKLLLSCRVHEQVVNRVHKGARPATCIYPAVTHNGSACTALVPLNLYETVTMIIADTPCCIICLSVIPLTQGCKWHRVDAVAAAAFMRICDDCRSSVGAEREFQL